VVGSTTDGAHSQLVVQAAASPNGSDPGEVTGVYLAYSSASTASVADRPMALNSQPMRCPGRRAMIRVPMAVKVV
jgi:hypothetical protein